jgi:hypothetical protein
MPRQIWKFPILVTEHQKIDMPSDAVILCVQSQAGQPCMWAQVDTDEELGYEKRRIQVFPTGHDLPSDLGMYIGTFQMLDGALVFHVYAD